MKTFTPNAITWQFLRQQKACFAHALFWRALFVLAPMQIPIISGAIVDRLATVSAGTSSTAGDGPELSHIQPLTFLMAGLAAVAIVYGVSAFAQMHAAQRLSRHFVSGLRKKVMQAITLLDLQQQHQYGSGELLDRALTDTANLRRFLERTFIQSLINGVRIAYPVAMLLAVDVRLTLLAMSVIPPQLLVVRYLQHCLQSATRRSRQCHAGLTTLVEERVEHAETIQALHAERAAMQSLNRRVDQVELEELAASRFSAAISGTVFFMTSLGLGLTWWMGALRVAAGEMTLGQLVVFTGFVAFTYQPFRQYTTMLSTYRRGLVSLERIGELLAITPSVRSGKRLPPLAITDGEITLQGVSLRRGSRQLLDNLSLHVPGRQLTAIIGPSGAGKSSLLRLFSRLYDPDAGRVLIDGHDISRVDVDSLRSQVVVHPQQAALFTGTVLENIRMARADAPVRDVRQVCRAAHALGFIERLPHGLDTVVGRGGVRLSGGQAQRIALARALLVEPRILVMDEPTAALDDVSERAVVQSLLDLRRRMTIVVVSHRPFITRCADHVVVMQDGRVRPMRCQAPKQQPSMAAAA